MRITWSAMRSASCSSGSLTSPMTSFGCMMLGTESAESVA